MNLMSHKLLDQPGSAAAWQDQGNRLQAAGQFAGAALCHRRALCLDPFWTAAWHHGGGALWQSGQTEAALAWLLRARLLSPGDDGVALTTSVLLRQGDDKAAARRAASRARQLAPSSAAAQGALAGALKDQDRLEAALRLYRLACCLAPDHSLSANNLAVCCERLDDLVAAETGYGRALRLAPANREAQFNRARVRLARGDWRRGWAEYEARWDIPALRRQKRAFPQPLWRGEAAAGARILLHAEQGFGDTLLVCRLVRQVAARGLTVLLEVPPPLVRLLAGLTGATSVLARGEKLPDVDWHCPLLSLPLALDLGPESIPDSEGYLQPDPDLAARWRSRVAGLAAPRVGLVWAGGRAPLSIAIDHRRSLDPALLAPLLAIPGIAFVSLQKDPSGRPAGVLADWMAEIDDFADSAALIAALDLVIAVDTAVAHLAGALGKPVWLLDRYDGCWRWLRGREDSPWYAGMRLFRQPSPGDWACVLDRVAAALTQWRRDATALSTPAQPG